MATLAGLEPATPSLEDSYSIQLSYRANLFIFLTILLVEQ